LGLFISCGNNESTETSANSLSDNRDTGHMLASVKKYPDSLILKENLIQAFRELNQYPRAISWANTFLTTDSTNARLWEILSVLEFESGDTTAAVRAMEKRAFFSTDLEGMQKLSTLYAVTGNPQTDDALNWLRKNGDPKQEADRIFTEGLYRSSLRDWPGALQAYDRCLNLDPHILDAYIEKAYVLCQLNKKQDAIQCLEQCTLMHNNFPEGYLELGYLYQESKQTEKARTCFQKALLYNPDFTEATEALAQLPSL